MMTTGALDIESFEQFFETMSDYFTNNPVLAGELVKARSDYFELTGKLNESDANFTNRMNAFLLWFTFDWRCRETLQTPFEMFQKELINSDRGLIPDDSLLPFANHVHSLFESVKLYDSHAIIRDLFNKTKYEVVNPNFLYGSAKGTYFETRIFSFNEKYHFSNYFIQHPQSVKKAVKKKCAQIYKKRESTKAFIATLHSYHTKWERYRNISIKNIYHFDKSLPEAK